VKAALVVVVAFCGACSSATYDPVAEVPHSFRELPNTTAAIEMILAENPTPKVYAIGEYHQTRDAIAKTSPLARFTREIIGLLEPHAKQLVLESWLDSACDSSQMMAHDISQTTGRPPATQMEMLRLVDRGRRNGLVAHTLPMTCIEQDAMLGAHAQIDFLLLLEVITQKLLSTTEALVSAEPDQAVIVYGGALHNDLYPRWPMEELSYAVPLAKRLHGGVLEIDLVVPEVVANMNLVRDEPWFPLLGRASPNRVIVWERGPSSYVVILPAQSEAVAHVAKL
jgi:hypothetical protein